MAGGKRPTKPKPNRRSERRLAFEGAVEERGPITIPLRYVTALIGLFLLPLCFVLTQTFFGAFKRATLEQALWATDEFWFFALGTVLWVLCFFGMIWASGEPRLLRVYVFGHELTHAIWVWAMGGEVRHFEFSRDGGSIVTNKQNVLIALAPYFYPIYSLAILLGYGAASCFYDVAGIHETFLLMTPLQWMFLGLGITWAFHMSFTCWMIPKGQSDLATHGPFFSVIFIYLMNVAIMAIFLIAAAPEVTWLGFGRELYGNAEELAMWIYGMWEQWRG